MATTQTSPMQGLSGQGSMGGPGMGSAGPGAGSETEQTAMVVVPLGEDDGPNEMSPVIELPVEIDVVVPVHEFRVRSLLAMQPGQLVETRWGNGEDVPLAAGVVCLAWGEFEVIEGRLAVRVTRLE